MTVNAPPTVVAPPTFKSLLKIVAPVTVNADQTLKSFDIVAPTETVISSAVSD